MERFIAKWGTGALGVPVGHRGAGCRYPCHLHLLVIPTPFIHQLLQSVEIRTAQRDVTFVALSTGGAEFRTAKRGCQLRQPIIYVSCLVR
jgi:hypothetical protein